jgi:hypothetical protein
MFAEIYREIPGAHFFSWAHGYMMGWNVAVVAQGVAPIDLSRLDQEQQKEFLRAYCDQNPLKPYRGQKCTRKAMLNQ